MQNLMDFEEDVCCDSPTPKGIYFYSAHMTGGAVAQCHNCTFTCVYWECDCELEHNCKEY